MTNATHELQPPSARTAEGAQSILLATVAELVGSLVPGATVRRVERIGGDASEAYGKAAGYGAPLKVSVVDAQGKASALVFRTATPNAYGHDRRSDRAAEILLAYDTFGAIPQHVRAIDVGAATSDGRLVSLRQATELYLVTSFAEGALYADRLKQVAERGATASDTRDAIALASYLADLHSQPASRPDAYRRSIRDLVGAGEGIFGIVDGYGPDVPGASLARLEALEARCARYRFLLRNKAHRATRIHGDFHPFNIVFDGEALSLLDASRGSVGDPADDVTALAVNYVFFSLGAGAAGRAALAELYHRFFDAYLERTGDSELFDVLAPFLAWRLLVLASPVWYPNLSAAHRDALLGLAERALETRFDPAFADEIFR